VRWGSRKGKSHPWPLKYWNTYYTTCPIISRCPPPLPLLHHCPFVERLSLHGVWHVRSEATGDWFSAKASVCNTRKGKVVSTKDKGSPKGHRPGTRVAPIRGVSGALKTAPPYISHRKPSCTTMGSVDRLCHKPLLHCFASWLSMRKVEMALIRISNRN
jgi:hypothetical protein